MDMAAIAALALAYFLGSIPFGLLLSKAMGIGDIRQIGSGNIGATNALRTGNKKLAALTLLCDLLKGTLAVLLARYISHDIALLCGLVAVIGHIFPVWLKFKGGKGVATALGVLLAFKFLVFLTTVIVWLGVFKLSRISSLSALTAFAFAPLFSFLSGNMKATLVVLLISILIFITHRANISRLIRGDEKPFGGKS